MKGALFGLMAFALYASHDVIIKLLGASYSPFQIIFFASLFSFPLVTFMLIRDATMGNLRPVHPWWIALRTFCSVVASSCAFYAFSALPLAQTYAILFAMPLIITVLSIPILKERVGGHRWAAVAVGLAGVLVVLQPGAQALTLGHTAALAAALFSGTAAIIIRKIGREERPVVVLLYPLAANFVVMAVLLPLVYKPMPLLHLGGLGALSVLGFVAGLLLIAAYRHSEAAIVAPMQYSQIIWASLFGALLFGDQLDRMTMIGTGIIIASGLYIVFRESRGGRSKNTPVLRTRSRGSTAASFRISPLLRRSKPRV